jgi:hypothetical protein
VVGGGAGAGYNRSGGGDQFKIMILQKQDNHLL